MKNEADAIFARGSEILRRADRQAGGWRWLDRKLLVDRLMNWSMRDEALKTQMFRFVDVLPALRTPEEIVRHLHEYLGTGEVPPLLRWGLRASHWFPPLSAWVAGEGVALMAKTFVLARTGAAAIPKLRAARARGLGFTVDILGEAVVSEKEADEYFARYAELLESLHAAAAGWPASPTIDASPRVNVSVKISALAPQIHPADPDTALAQLKTRLRPLLQRAQRHGALVNFDMENYALKDLTLRLFMEILDEPELADYAHPGIVIQAYLRDSPADLERLIAWARARSRAITIRLVKGAYWDFETITARQKGWPVPVWSHKAESDANYERLARRLLECGDVIRCAFGTHNVRSIAACAVHADALGLPPHAYEIQMLHGMAEPIKKALVDLGFRVREYCPIGEVLPGMAYLVRRLLENTSNEGFLRARASGKASYADLLRDPATERSVERKRAVTAFANAPLLDFTLDANRDAMRAALATERAKFGQTCPLLIGGRRVQADRELLSSVNPAHPTEIVGHFARATLADAEAAVQAAQNAWKNWRDTPIEQRARFLERTADLLGERHLELAALEVLEAGKPWIESDADLAEAIDFCRYYAREIRRLGVPAPTEIVPGEISLGDYTARGVCLVIAPWNFPLAILCGMTVAALVTGNSVILKPAEQSSVIAFRFAEILAAAGAPPGVVNVLTGPGEEIGEHLVRHPGVATIAFTGSKQVGLHIWQTAALTQPGQLQVKRVICEMGGKNSLIVDADADLDEAVLGTLHSAFGYAGQKCSALARVIVLKPVYARFLERLLEGARALTVGDPAAPGTIIGPVIDAAARARIEEYCRRGESEARLAYRGELPASDGYYIPPTIFAEVPPHATIAQEEIFGPVLCVIPAPDLETAFAIANDTPFALTAGFYSRSPANLERARTALEAGNIYLNRPITGAIVGRHPFGGWKMSGAGTKAGGREYLQNFLLPRVVTENTMRRGFSPGEG